MAALGEQCRSLKRPSNPPRYSKAASTAAVQGASHIFIHRGEPKAHGNLFFLERASQSSCQKNKIYGIAMQRYPSADEFLPGS